MVLLKTSLENQQGRRRRRKETEEVAAATPSGPGAEAAAGASEGIPLPNGGGSGSGRGGHAWGGSIKRKGGPGGTRLLPPPIRSSEKVEETGEAGRGRYNGDSRLLRRALEGVMDLAGHEEALFRQIVMFL